MDTYFPLNVFTIHGNASTLAVLLKVSALSCYAFPSCPAEVTKGKIPFIP